MFLLEMLDTNPFRELHEPAAGQFRKRPALDIHPQEKSEHFQAHSHLSFATLTPVTAITLAHLVSILA